MDEFCIDQASLQVFDAEPSKGGGQDGVRVKRDVNIRQYSTKS